MKSAIMKLVSLAQTAVLIGTILAFGVFQYLSAWEGHQASAFINGCSQARKAASLLTRYRFLVELWQVKLLNLRKDSRWDIHSRQCYRFGLFGFISAIEKASFIPHAQRQLWCKKTKVP